MHLQVPLSGEIEQRLRDEATAAGQELGEYVALVLAEHVAASSLGHDSPQLRTTAERLAFLEAIAARNPELPGPADSSRETIYAGRGR